jgi:branched-chain amino acid transport system substrate-binding protein
MLKAARPDIQIVGDELHPILKITDFSPYIAKIKASGADSVITGNWGDDMRLLLKAAGDSGLKVNWFTYNGAGGGSPTAARQAGLEHRLFQISEWHANVDSPEMQAFADAFSKKHGGANSLGWWYLRVRNELEMFAAAVEKAKSTEPKAVAAALSDLKIRNVLGADLFIRPDDHSVFQDIYISSFGGGVARDEEKTGWGWKTAVVIKAPETVLPTTCRMKRPA